MKRKLLALFLISTLLISYVGVYASDELVTPYRRVEAITYDKSMSYNGNNQLQDLSNRVGNLFYSGYLAYPNIDFGEIAPTHLEAEAGASVGFGDTIVVRLDDPNGEIIAEIPFEQISWITPSKGRVVLEKEITGVHTIYIRPKTSTFNFYGFQFFLPPDTSDNFSYKVGGAYEGMEPGTMATTADLLWQLGILQDKEGIVFDGKSYVSRAWFANAVYGIYKERKPGATSINEGEFFETGFTDVKGDNKYAEAIAYLADHGIISGGENGEFYPHRYIETVEAITILLRVLGYKELAEREGGYPNGYEKVARRIGIMPNYGIGESLKLEDACMVIDNALNAKYLSPTGLVKPDTTIYESLDGILEANRGLIRGVGRITGTYISALSIPETGLDEDEVYIDNAVYKVGECSASVLLGYDCEFYYREEDGTRTLYAIAADSQVQMVNILSTEDEIVKIDNNEIVYFPNGTDKEESIDLNGNTAVLYNGVAIEGSLTKSVLYENNFKGKITIIENSDGSKVVSVQEYKDYIVETIGLDDKSIGCKDGMGTISWEADDNILIRSSDGMALVLDDIEMNDVLTVYDSGNSTGRRLIRIYTSKEKAEGKVTAIDGKKLFVNGAEMGVSNSAKRELLPVGKDCIFSLNIYSEIVDVKEQTPGEWNTGLFIGYSYPDGGVFGGKPEVKIMTTDPKAIIYDVADTLIADGIRLNNGNDMLKGVSNTEGTWVGLSSIAPKTAVKYRLNADGKVYQLDTPEPGNGNTGDTMKCLFSGTSEATFKYFRASGLVFSHSEQRGQFYMPKGATVFGVNDEEVLTEGNCIVDDAYDLLNSTDINPYGTFYSTTGNEYVVDVFVWPGMSERLPLEDHLVFDSKSEVLNADGNIVTLINGWLNGGSKVSYIFDDSGDVDIDAASINVLNMLKSGDIIRYALLPDGKTLSKAEYWVLAGGAASRTENGITVTPKLSKINQTQDTSAYNRGVFGRVAEKGDGFIAIQIGIDELGQPITELFTLGSASVCCVENREIDGKVMIRGTDSTRIAEKDIVFAFTRIGVGRMIVIYDNVTW